MVDATPPGDPGEELVDEIADHLREHGEYVANVDPRPNQRMVDLRWASLKAGRRLGIRTRIHVSKPASLDNPTVRVTVVRADRLSHAVKSAREAIRAVVHPR